MEQKDVSEIGQDILFASRNELYMNLPYLDAVRWGNTVLRRGMAGRPLSSEPGLDLPGLSSYHFSLYAPAPGKETGQGFGAVGPQL